MSTRSSSGGPYPPFREIIWVFWRTPPPGDPPAPFPLPGSPGVLLSVMEIVSSSVSSPSSSLASPSSPPPSSGGPPLHLLGVVHFPPQKVNQIVPTTPLAIYLLRLGAYYFAPAQKAFPPFEGLFPGSGCHLLVGDLGLIVPP